MPDEALPTTYPRTAAAGWREDQHAHRSLAADADDPAIERGPPRWSWAAVLAVALWGLLIWGAVALR